MASSRKRARPGDVIEVSTPRGLAYVQYTAKHPKYGDAIRVLPGFFQVRPREWGALLAQEGYFTFYPVGAAVSQGLVSIAASQPIPAGRELPSVFRRRGWITPEGRVTTWRICDGEKETLRTELSPEERKLFIASIWNHAFLVQRLVEEWRPELEPSEGARVESPPSREEPPPAPGGDTPGRLSHYLYFPTPEVAEAVATELRQRGFEVESRPGADGVNWLVLASHRMETGEEFERVRDELEQLARLHLGEYDGWELATQS